MMQRCLLAILFCPAAFGAQAQDTTGTPASPDDIRPEDAKGEDIRNFDAVRVTAPRPTNPFAFRNPIEVEGTVFDRDWHETPSLEDIGMQGGIVYLAINYGLMKAAKQVTKLPGWKHQVRPATARPPPLDDAQMARAARLAETADSGNGDAIVPR